MLAPTLAQVQRRKGPGAKKAMGEMKTASPEMWKLKARSARVRASPNEPGIGDILARRQQVASFTSAMRQYVAIEHQVPIMWLTRQRYISRYMNTERMPEPGAIEEWQTDLDNPGVMKQGAGGSLGIAVRGIPVAVGLRGRESSWTITHTGSLPSAQAGATAAKRMASLSHAGSLASSEFAGLGDVYKRQEISRTLTHTGS